MTNAITSDFTEIPGEFIQTFATIATMAGSMDRVAQLPPKTMEAICGHPDAAMPVDANEPLIGLTSIDVTLGYKTWTPQFELINESPISSGNVWGYTKEENKWVLDAFVGDYCFVQYVDMAGNDRLLMIVRFADNAPA